MVRRVLLPALAALSLLDVSAVADPIVVDNSYSGWYDQTGSHSFANQNYFAGSFFNLEVHDFFVFDLSGLSGPLLSATFNVFSYDISVSGTYTVYGTSLPASIQNDCSGCTNVFSGLVSGPPLGSITVDPSDSDGTLTIALNEAALAWLQSNEGGQVVLGGAFPVPHDGNNHIFGFSGFNPGNNLTVTTVPEPATLFLLGSGVLGSTFRRRSRSPAASQAEPR
jgi:hypothetical protein